MFSFKRCVPWRHYRLHQMHKGIRAGAGIMGATDKRETIPKDWSNKRKGARIINSTCATPLFPDKNYTVCQGPMHKVFHSVLLAYFIRLWCGVQLLLPLPKNWMGAHTVHFVISGAWDLIENWMERSCSTRDRHNKIVWMIIKVSLVTLETTAKNMGFAKNDD